MEPFSSFSPQGSHLSICYYHQDLHRWRLQAGSPRHLQRTPPRPSYSLRRKPPRGKLCRTARYRPNAGASSIFRASCFGR
ncbi:hypothetical protein JTE90_011121 [Oedothorax gibbosus]|uniref:Uncharacterized protein n=1 Tax=Oedothorax gibbosus TaxID=931172 RepID=A0AAV6TDJ3_9ARAC|nr:hypothetical protein JTE90_011121 [Oedothorax gibbosus]